MPCHEPRASETMVEGVYEEDKARDKTNPTRERGRGGRTPPPDSCESGAVGRHGRERTEQGDGGARLRSLSMSGSLKDLLQGASSTSTMAGDGGTGEARCSRESSAFPQVMCSTKLSPLFVFGGCSDSVAAGLGRGRFGIVQEMLSAGLVRSSFDILGPQEMDEYLASGRGRSGCLDACEAPEQARAQRWAAMRARRVPAVVRLRGIPVLD